MRDLLSKKDPKLLKEYIDSGKIRIEGVGIGNQIKIALAKIFGILSDFYF
ncbi:MULTISPECIES: hypothetical protein [Archaeoglobus]|uniref:Uncharacterized protein AF_0030 n=1 Tax=Archaeoglobus fulgidus (strain ATCC 49558 / DSM 4304 / JCM 9628 / NBRC 100126 / VC-16) TaxID=224325 RepID=Y030_ARCFU|nr:MULTISPECIES: hypothetical protein [Archaeoglobus]O30205.1 RecName: Full=Uncharacterized protein AF_0030 [Archaeoglobus fulgidus DSM 4304]AAB91216.1 predicted coding region AF_0030 [Archaeoglobus fulgidus DSM 4304]